MQPRHRSSWNSRSVRYRSRCRRSPCRATPPPAASRRQVHDRVEGIRPSRSRRSRWSARIAAGSGGRPHRFLSPPCFPPGLYRGRPFLLFTFYRGHSQRRFLAELLITPVLHPGAREGGDTRLAEEMAQEVGLGVRPLAGGLLLSLCVRGRACGQRIMRGANSMNESCSHEWRRDLWMSAYVTNPGVRTKGRYPNGGPTSPARALSNFL